MIIRSNIWSKSPSRPSVVTSQEEAGQRQLTSVPQCSWGGEGAPNGGATTSSLICMPPGLVPVPWSLSPGPCPWAFSLANRTYVGQTGLICRLKTTAGTIGERARAGALGNPQQDSLREPQDGDSSEAGTSVVQTECWPCLRPAPGWHNALRDPGPFLGNG